MLSPLAGWRDSSVKTGSQTHTAVWSCLSWPLTNGHEDTQMNYGVMGLPAALSEVLYKILMQLGEMEASGQWWPRWSPLCDLHEPHLPQDPRSFVSDLTESWHRVQQVACGALSGVRTQGLLLRTPFTCLSPQGIRGLLVVGSTALSLSYWI